MTMNYLRKNKTNYKKIIVNCVAGVVVIFILSFFSPSFSVFFSRVAGTVAYPFWKSKSYVSEKFLMLGGLIESRESLVKSNIELTDQITHLRGKLFDLDLLEEENKNFRAILDRTEATSTLPAFILARPPLTGYDVFVLDLGSQNGVSVGQKVFFESIMLGEIVETTPRTSKVKLLSSGGVETEAFIVSQSMPIKLLGRGNGNLTGSVSQEVKVVVGDTVIIPGERNEILGLVDGVEHGPASSFKKIYVRLPINLSELRWVSIDR